MEINKLLTMEILYGKDVLYKNKKELSIMPLSFYDYNDATRSDMMNYKITLLGKLGDENSKDTLEYIQISSKSSITNDAVYLELITKYPDLYNKIQSFNIGQYYNVLADADYDHVVIFKVEDTLINKINSNNTFYKNNCRKLEDVPHNDKLPQQFFINTASIFTLLCRKFNINKSEFTINLFGSKQHFGNFDNDNQYLYLTFLSETIISENDFVKIIEEQLGFLLEKYDKYIIDKNYLCEESILESSYVLRFEYYKPITDEILDWLNNIKK